MGTHSVAKISNIQQYPNIVTWNVHLAEGDLGLDGNGGIHEAIGHCGNESTPQWLYFIPGGSNRGQGRRKFNNFNPDNYNSNAFATDDFSKCVFANPLSLLVCPVTALGLYFLTCVVDSIKIFPGDYEDSHFTSQQN